MVWLRILFILFHLFPCLKNMLLYNAVLLQIETYKEKRKKEKIKDEKEGVEITEEKGKEQERAKMTNLERNVGKSFQIWREMNSSGKRIPT